ncbi:MAG: hypothetical protein IPJ24_01165 [bacterium]|nr:hypothetical protein [bacterium]
MKMGLINWIFDIYQHTQIDKARDEARQARIEASSVRMGGGGGIDTARLERSLGELALATKTVQRMMVAKGICTREEFAALMREIDREDGVEDGRAPLG